MSTADVRLGDCRQVLRELADASVDAVVTDPPYEIGFMGRGWDASGIAYDGAVWREVLRVLKPGGHLLAFGASRTFHRVAVAIEDAGFELRDVIAWIRGGPTMPKGLDVSKAIDKAAGARGHEGRNMRTDGGVGTTTFFATVRPAEYTRPPAVTDEAKTWLGWHTALKPVLEPIVVARKPLDGTVVENVLEHGVGAYNVDGCRIGTEKRVNPPAKNKPGKGSTDIMRGAQSTRGLEVDPSVAVGRWPPNAIFSHLPTCGRLECDDGCPVPELELQRAPVGAFPAFRYQPKASRDDRGPGNVHPTVKPVELIRWCVRLVTPKGGVVVDPFTGSGTTGVACVLERARFIGAELSPEYRKIALDRINRAQRSVAGEQLELFEGMTL